MKNKVSLLCLIILLTFISGCFTPANKSTSQSDIIRYKTFTTNVNVIRSSCNTSDFKLITDGEKLNRIFTTFPDRQRLDPRNHDGVNGDPTLPSRYEFYYINPAETILIRLNLIYCPEFSHTRIIALLSNGQS